MHHNLSNMCTFGIYGLEMWFCPINHVSNFEYKSKISSNVLCDHTMYFQFANSSLFSYTSQKDRVFYFSDICGNILNYRIWSDVLEQIKIKCDWSFSKSLYDIIVLRMLISTHSCKFCTNMRSTCHTNSCQSCIWNKSM